MKKIILLMLITLNSYYGFSQCNVQINNRPDGSTIKYLRPELVASNERLELGLSLQTNGTNIYLGVVIRYLSEAYSPGDLTIGTELNQTMTLKLFHIEKSYMNGSNVFLASYILSNQNIKQLIASNIKYLTFRTSNKVLNGLKVTKNNDVLSSQYKCLSPIIARSITGTSSLKGISHVRMNGNTSHITRRKPLSLNTFITNEQNVNVLNLRWDSYADNLKAIKSLSIKNKTETTIISVILSFELFNSKGEAINSGEFTVGGDNSDEIIEPQKAKEFQLGDVNTPEKKPSDVLVLTVKSIHYGIY